MYLVKLVIFIECYEKHTVHLVKAFTCEEAGTKACLAESHNELVYCDYQTYQDGIFNYRVEEINPVPDDIADIIGSYL